MIWVLADLPALERLLGTLGGANFVNNNISSALLRQYAG